MDRQEERPMFHVAFALILELVLGQAPAAQREPPFYREKASLLMYVDAGGHERPITTAKDWPKRREHILANMQLVMGPLPEQSRKILLDVQVLEEVKLARYTRKKITYVPEKGDRVPAYLLIPHPRKGKAPAMLCLHPTTTVIEGKRGRYGGRDLDYAMELAERGLVTLSPDYLNSGDYAGKLDPYALGYASATMKGIWNHIRAADLLQSLPEVDADRIGVIGYSLGGHNAMFVAAFDTRLKVIVLIAGFDSIFCRRGGGLAGWGGRAYYMFRVSTVYGNDPQRMPFDFSEVLGALAPRPVFISAPIWDVYFDPLGVRNCVQAARPAYDLFGASAKLVVSYPDAEHGFPPEVRKAAYEFIERFLRN
jgi:acetyl esterase/lipase